MGDIRYNVNMVEWSFDTRDAQATRNTRLDFVKCINYFYEGEADAMAAELVLGELIGNVVRYAPGPAHVQADFDELGVTIAVHDSGNGFSAPKTDHAIGLLSESGRGLAIVSTLAETVEIDCPQNDGCYVRARLGVRRMASSATADTSRRLRPDARACAPDLGRIPRGRGADATSPKGGRAGR